MFKKFIIWMAVAFVSVLVNFLIADGADTTSPIPTPKATTTYAGFEEIIPKKNHFILVGDTQATSHWEFWRESNDKERKLIIDEITRQEPAFVVHLGDLTTRGSSTKHWQQFDDFHKEFREKKIPYFPVMGNHEFYGGDKRALQNYFGRFPHLAQRRWYSFIWKNIGFIMLDSNFPTLTEKQIEEQSQWYSSELERFENDEKIDFIIVCCHAPPFTNSQVVRPNEKVRAFFADPFLKHRKTIFFFSGHCHSYERFQIENKFFIISGGGGGPRHKLAINPEKRRYHDLFEGSELRFFHIVSLRIQDNMIISQVYRLEPDETFSAIDPITIQKNKQK